MKTKPINTDANPDLMADSIIHFVHMLRDTALNNNAPDDAKKDWKVIADWLDCSSGHLTAEHNEKIANAWKAYHAIGMAPSVKLQKTFDYFRHQYKSSGFDVDTNKASMEVMNVFHRMLATDEEIARKRKFDLEADRMKIAAVLGKTISNSTTGIKQTDGKKNRVSLNGWQRLYLVIFFLYFTGCTIYFGFRFASDGIYEHTDYNYIRLENELRNRGLSVLEVKQTAASWYEEYKKGERKKIGEKKSIYFNSFKENHLPILLPDTISPYPIYGIGGHVYYYLEHELKIDPKIYIDKVENRGLTYKGKEIITVYLLSSVPIPLAIYMAILFSLRVFNWVMIGFKKHSAGS